MLTKAIHHMSLRALMSCDVVSGPHMEITEKWEVNTKQKHSNLIELH